MNSVYSVWNRDRGRAVPPPVSPATCSVDGFVSRGRAEGGRRMETMSIETNWMERTARSSVVAVSALVEAKEQKVGSGKSYFTNRETTKVLADE